MVPPASDFSACHYLCIFTPPFSVFLLCHKHGYSNDRTQIMWDLIEQVRFLLDIP
jgi:hypothetical protein